MLQRIPESFLVAGQQGVEQIEARYVFRLEPYGNYILIALVLIPGILSIIVTPFYRVIEFVIRRVAAIILGIVL